jgi:hypothetical protein
MDWQQLVSLAIVSLTVVLLVWSKIRRPKFTFERLPHCGCGCAASHQAPKTSVVLRARKGERPRMIIRMK